ncbi:MAG TPA: phosphate ABC transporter substrate-binding protein [Candidatus Krumholzibacteria bacterium]|nr:phosphate ABC transporter substrate-binding protein [Candidatus Krumholzibacteria bacterium]
MKRLVRGMLSLAVLVCVAGTARAQVIAVDAKLPAYDKVDGVKGNLSSIGSDTMNNLMTLWAEGFQKHYPAVQIQVEGKGSSTAPPALIEGTAQLGPMSRNMKADESDAFEKKHGFKPTGLRTSMDALAVFVHKDNPLESISLDQVDAVFSKTRKRGYSSDVVTWGQLGLTGEWERKPLSIYGRNSASGTYGFFKEEALKKGDYKDTVKEQPGSASVVQGITEDRFGIGYSGIGYRTSGVKSLALAPKAGAAPVVGNYENCLAGTYPLGRYLNLYVAKDPSKPLDPVVREFVRFIFSKEGQEIVVKDGYFPLTAAVCAEELQKLGLELKVSTR